MTLTGTGGCGKTRLALEVAARVQTGDVGGAWFELAPLADPCLVPQTVLASVNPRQQFFVTPLDALIEYLRSRHGLLLLDNCEHVLDASAELADALPGAVLSCASWQPAARRCAWRASSRAVCHPWPYRSRLSDGYPSMQDYEAVRLFVERAIEVHAEFELTPRNAPVVAAICSRLEGLPLAIELAAAWVRALGVEQILERLDDAVGLLVGGSPLAPSRQRTMRAALDWSHGLLKGPERAVFRRLAVFVGGWTLESAEAICSGGEVVLEHVLSLVTRLVDASLVQVEERDGRACYRLLEPVRQYAYECLASSQEFDAVCRKHSEFFLSFAQRWGADANPGGPAGEPRLTRSSRRRTTYGLLCVGAWSTLRPTGASASGERIGSFGSCAADSRKGERG